MASWSSIHVNTNELQSLIAYINQNGEFKLSRSVKYPEDFNDSYLMFSEDPNYILISQTQKNWVTIRYNCLSLQNDLCKNISKELNLIVCTIIAQSTVDYIEFCKYEKGGKVRHYIDSPEDQSNELDFGELLKEELDLGLESKDFFYFNDVCELFGLKIQIDYDNFDWLILKKDTRELSTSEFAKKLIKRKPWWQFW